MERWRIGGAGWDKIGSVLGEKVREAVASVAPITGIVLVLCFSMAPVPNEVLLAFLIGAVLLVVGMGLFALGAETAMTPIGQRVGAHMTRSRKLWVVVSVSFLIGVIITVSEPDLQVLAEQVPGIPNAVLVGAVAVGCGHLFWWWPCCVFYSSVPLGWLLWCFTRWCSPWRRWCRGTFWPLRLTPAA